ncbi:hypothetical protein CVT24_012205 [Panaeolus cyanescens]|uniref:Chaplin domain-containing protein n=1 Tax=Panaeolus cyanescens TaxID=181874 RepID=A0A409WXB7_9AGAR|nr:hypothetical protein CVT24_012205 [Panaeolus cyanescens]
MYSTLLACLLVLPAMIHGLVIPRNPIDATGASESPGTLSGNVIQVPANVPINACGNTVDVIALINPTFANECEGVDSVNYFNCNQSQNQLEIEIKMEYNPNPYEQGQGKGKDMNMGYGRHTTDDENIREQKHEIICIQPKICNYETRRDEAEHV